MIASLVFSKIAWSKLLCSPSNRWARASSPASRSTSAVRPATASCGLAASGSGSGFRPPPPEPLGPGAAPSPSNGLICPARPAPGG